MKIVILVSCFRYKKSFQFITTNTVLYRTSPCLSTPLSCYKFTVNHGFLWTIALLMALLLEVSFSKSAMCITWYKLYSKISIWLHSIICIWHYFPSCLLTYAGQTYFWDWTQQLRTTVTSYQNPLVFVIIYIHPTRLSRILFGLSYMYSVVCWNYSKCVLNFSALFEKDRLI